MISRFFIDRPVFATVISIVIVLAGLAAMRALPIAQYPEILPPQVSVSAAYPGASSQVIAETVAAPLEQAINGVENMIYQLSNSSSSGAMSLTVYFAVGTDPDQATINVNNKVQAALAKLPEEVRRQGVKVEKKSSDILQVITLYSPDDSRDPIFISNYALINVIDELKRLKGVGDASQFGSKDYSMRIWLRPDKLAQYNLTPTDVVNAIREQNSQFAAGSFGQQPLKEPQDFTYTVTTQGRFTDPKEFESVILRTDDTGASLLLKDVARVELGAQDYSLVTTLNGQQNAAFGIYLQPGANALDTAEAVERTMQRLAKRFPEGIAYKIPYDTTKFVQVSITEVIHTFFEALVLVVLVVFIFLQNWRATLIPVLAIPVSLVGTFAGMYMLGFSINLLTLFGMVLAIGIVVDDAIVVVEAVEHHMEHSGLNARDATLRAMEEVSGPVVAIALILAAVFVPVAFLGGISGVMYKQFAITVAVSTVLSAFVALSLTPALCALMLKPKDKNQRPGLAGRFFGGFNRVFERLTDSYGRKVQTLIRRSLLSLLMLGILIFAAFGLMNKVPGGFVPSEDQGYFLGSVQLPAAASLNRTEIVTTKVDAILKSHEAVDKRLIINGYNILNGAPQSDSALFVATLKPWAERSTDSLKTVIMGTYLQAAKLPEAIILAFNPPPIPGLGSTGGFSFKLQDRSGGTPQELAKVADDFMAAARQRPEIGSIYSKFNPRTPAYRLAVDREKAKKLGVPISDVTNALQTFLGGLNVNDFSRFGRTYKVTMQAEPEYRSDIQGIGLFHVRNGDNQMIPLSTLVTPMPTSAPTVLERYNLYRTAELGGNPGAGYSSGDAIAAMEDVAATTLPAGYGFEWSGISRQEKESAGKAPIVFGLAIVFVFLFLAALYESWAVPFAVLFAVPLGVFGAMLGLWLTGLTNNIYAQIGLILLIGLAAKNAILIVEFAKMKREEGEDAVSAAIAAAKLRLRPIIMTSFAFILGVVPLIIASGAGAAARVSMGITVFAGMLAATLLAIFMVPVLFVAVDRVVARFSKKTADQPEVQA